MSGEGKDLSTVAQGSGENGAEQGRPTRQKAKQRWFRWGRPVRWVGGVAGVPVLQSPLARPFLKNSESFRPCPQTVCSAVCPDPYPGAPSDTPVGCFANLEDLLNAQRRTENLNPAE